MARNKALFSGKFQEYITPKWLYKQLDDEFHFTLDPCTTKRNPLGTPKFYTKKDDGLHKSWRDEMVYCNPPYGKEVIDWVKHADYSVDKAWYPAKLVVMLLPARTDTKWFHDYIYKKHEIRFLRGRLKFEGVAKNTAPFPSMIVIFR